MRRLAIALVCGLLMGSLVSCGGDDEKASETVPTVTTETETTPTTDTTPTATSPPPPARRTPPRADPDSGGTTLPKPPANRQLEDGPDNDIPPEPGSPAERFERQCEQNPETCGD